MRGSAHHIGRQLEDLGRDVRLIPAQYVRPFLKGHENDYRDPEAVPRPTMYFVSVKTFWHELFTPVSLR
jgi:transposase